jgi:hypothetical protein
MGRTIKRLSGLEIDEVSLVDRPANQHGLVAIAKNYQEDNMGVYDAAGEEVFEEELQHGDCVYDDAGNEFVFVEEDADEYSDDLVNKGPMWNAVKEPFLREASRAGAHLDTLKGKGRGAISRGRDQVNQGRLGRSGQQDLNRQFAAEGEKNVKRGGSAANRFGRRTAGITGRKLAYGGGGLAVAGTAGYASKSLGDEVMESLSKALTDTDRSEVIANAMDYMDDVAKRNENLEEIVAQILHDRENEGFVELAKSYELPANYEDIAGVMQRASESLPQGDLALLDRMFSAMSDVNKSSYEELGYSGGYESDSLSQIYAAAGEVVSKSGADMTQEQAVTALFSANSDAYDEYESEQRYNR